VLRLKVELAGLEALAECTVGQLEAECSEAGQLEVAQPVAVAEQLQVVARCRHSGNFYRAPPSIYHQIFQNFVFVVCSTFRFYCFCSLSFSCIIAIMSTNLLWLQS
jgi:hypothetical protein